MLVKRLNEIQEIRAGDYSVLKEILHPKNDSMVSGFSMAYATVAPESTTIPHSLEQSEAYYILKGTGKMTVGLETEKVSAGDTVFIPPNTVHYIQNTSSSEPLEFLCMVCPEWKPDKEKIIQW